MKKIDLHIHTIPTISDADFNFDEIKLLEYVSSLGIHAIAITNHNVFNYAQYENIKKLLNGVVVFPGIEVNLEQGHILVITDDAHVSDFSSKARQVSGIVTTATTSLTLAQFRSIFPDFSNYILIPHYDKKPALSKDIIGKLPEITAGEVKSTKKFIACRKDSSCLVPLYFSDCRLTSETDSFSGRQTYVDVGDITLSALREAFKDRSKVALDPSHDDLIDIEDGEVKISSGLSVVLGRRSSGKSYTLVRIFKQFGEEKVKYIRQFSLVRDSDDENHNLFDSMLAENKNSLYEDFLSEFKQVVDEIISINDQQEDERKIQDYLENLKKFATAENLKDIYSNCPLYTDYSFDIKETDGLAKLMDNVIALLDNTEYRVLIDRFINRNDLIQLLNGLYAEYVKQTIHTKKLRLANEMMEAVNQQLQFNSSSPRLTDINFYDIALNCLKRRKFEEVCSAICKERVVSVKYIGKFTIQAKSRPFKSASDMKSGFGRQMSVVEIFKKYDEPLEYITSLKHFDYINNADIYKSFVGIDYNILNEYGLEVSGGEKSEYNLLNAIQDARNYDMLLIDEPESSFDNIFLKEEVNVMLKDLAQEMPVVVVTHNNTIGESIHPDYLIYTQKEIIDNKDLVFRVYCGYPTDKCLVAKDGHEIMNYTLQLDSLEAGQEAYLERKKTYENLKN